MITKRTYNYTRSLMCTMVLHSAVPRDIAFACVIISDYEFNDSSILTRNVDLSRIHSFIKTNCNVFHIAMPQ